MFQPGASGGTGSVLLGVQGSPLETEFEERIAAEAIGVIPVCIPRSDLRDAWRQQVAQRVVSRGAMALLMDSRRKARGQPNLTVDTSSEERPKVRRQGPTLEICTQGLAGDRGKTQLFWARIEQKQTSCGLYGMDASHILFYQRLTRGLCFFMKNSG